MSGLALYNTEDRDSRIQLHADGQTFWLSQLNTAELFQTSKQIIATHLMATCADGAPQSDPVINHWLTTAAEGKNCRATQ